jgi:hypothetical protein
MVLYLRMNIRDTVYRTASISYCSFRTRELKG